VIVIDEVGQTTSRSEDTDYDGSLDAKNAYLADGRLGSRERTRTRRQADRWIIYDGNTPDASRGRRN
jgi:hypothetical protein